MDPKEKTLQADNISSFHEEGRKVILVVEDDRTHRNLMQEILKECAFEVEVAENGAIALSRLESGQVFDLVLMDWDMPEMNGLEATRAIRAYEVRMGLAHTPVIAFTSNRNPGDREQCLAAGMDAYLPKDVWLPKWRPVLIDNLQGLITGNLDMTDFSAPSKPKVREVSAKDFDLEAFDIQTLEQSADLLKEEFPIAVEEYLEDASAYIRDIGEGLEKNDAEKAARGSHPLKSNSKSFGLIAVSEIAEAINRDARKGKLESTKTLLPQLEEAFNRAEKKLRETMGYAGY